MAKKALPPAFLKNKKGNDGDDKKEIPSGGLTKTKRCGKCGKSHVLTHPHFK